MIMDHLYVNTKASWKSKTTTMIHVVTNNEINLNIICISSLMGTKSINEKILCIS